MAIWRRARKRPGVGPGKRGMLRDDQLRGGCRMRAGRRQRMRRQYGGKLDGKGCRLAMKLMIDEEEPWGGAGSKTAMTTEEDEEGHSRSSRPGMAVRSSRCFLQIIYIAIIHSKNNSGCSPAHRASLEVKSFLFLPPVRPFVLRLHDAILLTVPAVFLPSVAAQNPSSRPTITERSGASGSEAVSNTYLGYSC